MRYLFTVQLLLTFIASTAQVRISQVMVQVNAGIGISTRPATMFGTPLFLSGELAFTLINQWRIVAEVGGVIGFRDSKNPTQKIGLIIGSYSRYPHNYGGLRIGRNLLSVTQAGELFLSSGADYLAVIEPNVKTSSGLLGGNSFDYRPKRNLNIPIQLDYSTGPFGGRNARITFSGRWNFNRYHSFPTISVGVGIPVYNRRASL